MGAIWLYLELRLLRYIFAMEGVQYLFWIGLALGLLLAAIKGERN